jgi:hypothetical protein
VVPRNDARARQRPSAGGDQATLPPTATRRRRLKCQPVNGSNRSIWISTLPDAARSTSGVSSTGAPGVTVVADALSTVAVISRISSESP